MKTEIHPTLPKITVTGNVDVRTLIRKLVKSGKSAELWPSDTPIQVKEENQSESQIKETTETSNEKDEAKDGNGDNQQNTAPKRKQHDEEEEPESKNIDEASSCQAAVTTIPQAKCLVNPGLMPPYVQGYYPAHQPTYYAMNMNAYSASPPFCVHDGCHCQLPAAINPPPMQPQSDTSFADYFNDENTVGCSVM